MFAIRRTLILCKLEIRKIIISTHINSSAVLIKEGELCSQGDRGRRAVIVSGELGVAGGLSEPVELINGDTVHS